MSGITAGVTIAAGGSAPNDPSIATEHLETHLHSITLGSVRKISEPFSVLLKDKLVGCGQVDLVELSIKFVSNDAKQKLMAGYIAVGTPIAIEQASLQKGGIRHCTNTMNYGTMEEFAMVVPDVFSRQIQPVSSLLPTPQFMLEASDGASVCINIAYKVHGVIRSYEILN